MTGHRTSEQPDATAPDGSEIRFLIDHRHRAQGASMVEVTLPPGQVSRPVWHRTVEEVWYMAVPVQVFPIRAAAVSVRHHPALARPRRGPTSGYRRIGDRYGLS